MPKIIIPTPTEHEAEEDELGKFFESHKKYFTHEAITGKRTYDPDIDNESDTLPKRTAPYSPFKIDYDGVPVFNSQQVEIFGPPDYWGFQRFRVEECREDAHPFVMDWDQECEARGNLRPIHRYDRVSRFKTVLLALLGERKHVPSTVMDLCKNLKVDKNIWSAVRKILSKNKIAKSYLNGIPTIIKRLTNKPVIEFTWKCVVDCLRDFCKISHEFDSKKMDERGGRKYFPNLRFIAIKLLAKNGAVINLDIPVAVVKRKREAMEKWWSEFVG